MLEIVHVCDEECPRFSHCFFGKCICNEGYGARESPVDGSRICQVNNVELEKPMAMEVTSIDKLISGQFARSTIAREEFFRSRSQL